MTIFDLLKSDHKKIGALLKKLGQTKQTQATQRTALFEKLRDAFLTHSASEEKAVYRPLRQKAKTHDIVMEGYEEHGLVDYLLEHLENLPPTEDTWTAKMTVLSELVEHHVEEEETIMFKKMKAAFKSEELNEMARSYKDFKKEKSQLGLNQKSIMKQNQIWAQ